MLARATHGAVARSGSAMKLEVLSMLIALPALQRFAAHTGSASGTSSRWWGHWAQSRNESMWQYVQALRR